MNKINCLYISYDGLTEPIGRSQILPYIEGLSEKGIKFVILTFDKKQYRSDKIGISEVRESLQRNGNEWVSLLYHKNPPIVSTAFDVMKALFVSAFLVVRRNIRVVHARSYVAALVAFFLKRIFSTKFIFDMRGFWVDERIESHLWPRGGILYKTAKYFEKRFLGSADEIIVLTHRTKEIINNLNFSKDSNISVIPCSVNMEFFNFNIIGRGRIRARLNLGNNLTFLHAGSLEEWYRLEDMFYFVKVMKETGAKVRFIILSHQKKDIYALSRKAGLDGRELIYSAAAYKEMPYYISSADVGLFFIAPTPSKMASVPSKFAEYLSCGMPVVCNTKIGDLEDIIRVNRIGVVLDLSEKEAYKKAGEALKELLKDPDVRNRCRNVAREFFSLDRAVNKYYTAYERALDTRSCIIANT